MNETFKNILNYYNSMSDALGLPFILPEDVDRYKMDGAGSVIKHPDANRLEVPTPDDSVEKRFKFIPNVPVDEKGSPVDENGAPVFNAPKRIRM